MQTRGSGGDGGKGGRLRAEEPQAASSKSKSALLGCYEDVSAKIRGWNILQPSVSLTSVIRQVVHRPPFVTCRGIHKCSGQAALSIPG